MSATTLVPRHRLARMGASVPVHRVVRSSKNRSRGGVRSRFHTGRFPSVLSPKTRIVLFDGDTWETVIPSFNSQSVTQKRGKSKRHFTGPRAYNGDSASATVTYRRNDGSQSHEFFKITLATNETLLMNDADAGFDLGGDEYIQVQIAVDVSTVPVLVFGRWEDKS